MVRPQGRANAEQLTRRDVQRDDLVAAGRGADNADMSVQQQKEPVNGHAFDKYCQSRIEPFGLRLIQNLADLWAGQTAERGDIGEQTFVQIIQFLRPDIDPAQHTLRSFSLETSSGPTFPDRINDVENHVCCQRCLLFGRPVCQC